MRHKQAGFTLIEMLVALMVFAVVAGSVQRCLAGGWRAVKLVRLEEAALAVAKAQIAGAGIDEALTVGNTTGGTTDGLSWSRDVRRYEYPQTLGFETPVSTVFWVTVAVRWHEGLLRPERSLELRTLKIRGAP